MPIVESHRDKTAFITRSGCCLCTVMLFRLTGAPASFTDLVLCGLSYIIITSDEQLKRLRELFQGITKANMKLKPLKCSLFQRSIAFLGHVVTMNGWMQVSWLSRGLSRSSWIRMPLTYSWELFGPRSRIRLSRPLPIHPGRWSRLRRSMRRYGKSFGNHLRAQAAPAVSRWISLSSAQITPPCQGHVTS